MAVEGVEVLRPGAHVTLAAYGEGVQIALEAAEVLEAEGILASVVDLVRTSPLEEAGLGASVESTGRLIVVVPELEAAWGRQVAAVGVARAFWSLRSPPRVVRDLVGAVVDAARASLND